MNKPLFFVHGGPGFNSLAERNTLAPELIRVGWKNLHFWDEPSRERPDGESFDASAPWSGWQRSLQARLQRVHKEHGPVILMAHSFGAIAACEVAQRFPEQVVALLFLTPAFDIHRAFLKILSLARTDFQRSDKPDFGERLEQIIKSEPRFFDEKFQEGISLALQDPGLFRHYWVSDEGLAAWGTTFEMPAYQFNADSFFGVCSELRDSGYRPESLPALPSTLPVHCWFGDRDPVVVAKDVLPHLNRIAPHAKTRTFQNHGHFCQLEKPAEFAETLKQVFLNHF